MRSCSGFGKVYTDIDKRYATVIYTIVPFSSFCDLRAAAAASAYVHNTLVFLLSSTCSLALTSCLSLISAHALAPSVSQ